MIIGGNKSMKKKIWQSLGIAVLVILLSAGTAFGLMQLFQNENVAKTGNVLGVDWYTEEETEFTITTAQQLREFAKLSKFYNFKDQTVKLGADIILNEGNAADWKDEAPQSRWTPIRNFAGTFDGQGHSISGLYAKTHEVKMALFVDTNYTCRIQNAKLVNSYFETSGHSGVAGFVSNGGGKFIGLYSDAIMNHNGENVGGIGSIINKQSVFEECWFDGSITTTLRECGGIVDSVEGARTEIRHCLFSGTISQSLTLEGNGTYGGTMTGGLIGRVDATGSLVVNDCLSSGEVKSEMVKYTGGAVGVTWTKSQNSFRDVYMSSDSYGKTVGTQNGTNDGKPIAIRDSELIGVKAYQWTALDFDKYWVAVENDTPVLSRFAETKLNLNGVEKAYDSSWYKNGMSTFEISNLKQLYGLGMVSAYDNFNNKIIKLGADIVVNEGTPAAWLKNGAENPWYTIANFAGTFDGQGHTISGIYHVTGDAYQGVFGQTTDAAIIKNLRLENSYFESKMPGEMSALGSIAGEFRGKMENVYSNATVISHGTQSGGLIGRSNDNDSNGVKDAVQITNCWFDGELHMKGEKTMYGGGIAGLQVQGDLEIKHCLNTGLITSEVERTGVHIGGIAGAVWGKGSTTIEDCLNVGKVLPKYTVGVGSVLGRSNNKEHTTNILNTYTTKESYVRAVGSAHYGITNGGVIRLSESWYIGNNAYKWTELDFPNYWAIVKNKTPILQTFASSDPSTSGLVKAVDTSWYKADAKEFVIDNVAKLYGFAMLGATTDFAGKTVKLGADIKVNTVNESILASWANETAVPENTWIPIGDTSKPFEGTFDGQGHTISGMYLKTDETYNGMFGYTSDKCMIKNFRLADSCFINTLTTMNAFGSVAGELRGDMDGVYSNAIVIANGSQAGGIIGRINDPDSNGVKDEVIVTNCWFDGELRMKNNTGVDGGGIAARLMQGNLIMKHCLNTGLISAEATKTGVHVGGIMGSVRSANSTFNLIDSLNTGKMDVVYPTCVGSVLGRATTESQVVTIENTYSTSESYNRTIGSATAAKIVGEVQSLDEKWYVGDNAYRYTCLDFEKYWTLVENDTPMLQKFATSVTDVEELAKLVDTDWFNTKKKTHHIDTVAELFGFMKLAMAGNTFKGHTIYLDASLSINDVQEDTIGGWKNGTKDASLLWIPVGNTLHPFEGTFDGQGNTVTGLYVKTGSRYAGLFGYVQNANVGDIRIKDSYFESTNTGTASLASIVGGGNGTVKDVYSNATINACGAEVGGIVANASGMLIDTCWYDGEATLAYSTGTSSVKFGGIVGTGSKNANVIDNCLFTGSMDYDYYGTNPAQSTSSPWIGGIAGGDGSVAMTIKNTISAGEVSMVWQKKAAGNTAKSNKFINVDDVLGYKVNENTTTSNLVYSATVADWRIEDTGSANDVSGSMSADDLSGVKAFYITLLDYENDWAIRKDAVVAPKSLVAADEIKDISNVAVPDTSWYDESESEFHISTLEELYGMVRLSIQGVTFKDQVVYLDNDIAINVVETGTIDTWKAGNEPTNIWIPIGSEENMFMGTFDGKGHTISGLYLKTGVRYVGFFGCAKDATIRNLRLEDSYLESTRTGSASIGSIAGYASGKISHVYSNATICSVGVEVGGLVSRAAGLILNGCWYDGSARIVYNAGTDSARFGGLVGTGATAENTIKDCLFTGNLRIDYQGTSTTQSFYGSRVGGLVGGDNGVKMTIKDTIGTGTLTAIWHKQAAGNTASNVTFGRIDDVLGYATHADTTFDTNVYSAITAVWKVEEDGTNNDISGSIDISALLGTAGFYGTALDFDDMWVARTGDVPAPRRLTKDGQITGLKKADTSWYDADDVKEEYVLADEEELMGLANLVNSGTKFTGITIKLGKDMVLNEVNEELLASWKDGSETPQVVWTPIGNGTTNYFDGIFDGQGHTISGLYRSSTNYTGLFGAAGTNSQIKNVAITDSVFRATGDYLGGVVGFFWGTKMENVYSDVSLVMLGSSAKEMGFGGIVGRLRVWQHNISKTFSECWYAGDITIGAKSFSRIGGIIGDVFGDYTGFTLRMKDCLFTGTMSINSAATIEGLGGVIGVNSNNMNHTFVLENCVNAGTITDAAKQTDRIGLFASSMSATASGNSIKNCYVIDDGKHDVLSATPFGKANSWAERDEALADVKVAKADLLAKEKADLTSLFGTGASDVWQCYIGERGTAKGAPVLKRFADLWVEKQKLIVVADTLWFDPSNKKAEYTLFDEDELLGFATLVNGGEKFSNTTIKLNRDMVMNEVNKGTLTAWKEGTRTPRNIWPSIGNGTTNWFHGTFDGCGKNIKGLYVNGNGYEGFFGAANATSVIKNFSVTDSVLKSSGNFVGGVIGYSEGSTIENVYSDAIVMPSAIANGGIVGRWRFKAHNVTKVLRNCWFAGEIVINQGTVTGTGGLIGDLFGGYDSILKMEDCLFDGKIVIGETSTATVSFVGGILGMNRNNCQHTFQLKNCVSAGQIQNDLDNTFGVGLFAGAMSAKNNNKNSIQNCYVVAQDSIENKVGYSQKNSSRYVEANAWEQRDSFITKVERSALLAKNEADLTQLFGSGASETWVCNIDGTPLLKSFAKLWLAK